VGITSLLTSRLTINRSGATTSVKNIASWVLSGSDFMECQLWPSQLLLHRGTSNCYSCLQPCQFAIYDHGSSVQTDIIRNLKMSEERLFTAVHPFNRANLFYEIKYTAALDSVPRMSAVHDFVMTLHRRRARPSSGIIYCRARKTCDELSAFLRGKGISARPYHRGIRCVV